MTDLQTQIVNLFPDDTEYTRDQIHTAALAVLNELNTEHPDHDNSVFIAGYICGLAAYHNGFREAFTDELATMK